MSLWTISPPLEILVIEDDADARANLRDILELDGHRVDRGRQRRRGAGPRRLGEFSAIILDRRLPDATAEQLMPRLKAVAPDAAVIVVTGYSDLQGAIAALRQGATDYILKPLNADAAPHQPGPDRRTTPARPRQGAKRCRLPSPGRGRRVHDRHPPARSLDRLLQPVRRTRSPATRPTSVQGATTSTLLVPEPDRRRRRRGIHASHRRPPTRGFENPVVCRDGSRRWMVWNARYLADYEDGPAILERRPRHHRISSRPRSGRFRPSDWPPSARWSPAWRTRAATPCSAARPAWRCSPWPSGTGPKPST